MSSAVVDRVCPKGATQRGVADGAMDYVALVKSARAVKAVWQSRSVGDVCRIVGGGTPAKGRKDFYCGDIPWATVRDMRRDVISETEFSISRRAVEASSTNVIPAGNVIIATRVGLGKVCFVERDTAINQDLRGVVPLRRGELSTRFLFWWFKSVAHLIEKEGTGATVKGVKLPFIKSLQIPVPPPIEQQRIVAILDDAFAGIANARASAEQNLHNARELFESQLQIVFSQCGAGWERVRIDQVCQSIMDCVNKTAPKVAGPTPFKMIRTTNIRGGNVSLDSVNYVEEEIYKTWTRRQVPARGDILLTREAPMGEVGMLLSDDRVFLGQRVVSYRADNEKIDSRFLLYALQSGDLQNQIKALASGSTVQHMRVPDSKALMISLPSLDKQRAVVDRIEFLRTETTKLESIYQQKIAALDELKQSLLDRAFAGAL